MTGNTMGDYEKAFWNYQAAFTVLASRIVKAMKNERSNPIYPHPKSPFRLWMNCAFEGGIYLGVRAGNLRGIDLPTPEMAEEEFLTHPHEGLLWSDRFDTEGYLYRLYLPNYFNTFFDLLSGDSAYFYLINNMSKVLDLLGRQKEAHDHFQESEFFMSLFNKRQFG